ncbi:MAG: hypothetical protein NTW56_21625 [Alphaproteobacteria bacterium]|nr:hypothetical protein [Alphaproteobacteria bacterium]
MRPIALLALIALAACELPPARHAAFSDTVTAYAGALRVEAERAQTMALPPPPLAAATPVLASGPRAQRSPRDGAGLAVSQLARTATTRRARQAVAVAPAPQGADCQRMETLTGLAREYCAAVRHGQVVELAWRHAAAMAAYVDAIRELASRFDAGIPAERLEELRDATYDAGARLRAAADFPEDQLDPFRPVPVQIGLRQAFMTEMGTHGWRLRQQFQIQAEALQSLEDMPMVGTEERMVRLRWAIAYLRSAFEVMTTSDRDANAEISQARRALGL